MGVLKYSSVRYESGGVDIQNTVNIPILKQEQEAFEEEETEEPAVNSEPAEVSIIEQLKEREALLDKRESELGAKEHKLENRT